MNVIKRNNKWQYDFRIGTKRYRKQRYRIKKDAEQAGIKWYNALIRGIDVENDIAFDCYAKKGLKPIKNLTFQVKRLKITNV